MAVLLRSNPRFYSTLFLNLLSLYLFSSSFSLLKDPDRNLVLIQTSQLSTVRVMACPLLPRLCITVLRVCTLCLWLSVCVCGDEESQYHLKDIAQPCVPYQNAS